MRSTPRPTRPRSHLLAWLLLASMAGIAHAQESAEVPAPTVGLIELAAHPIPAANELPGDTGPSLVLAKLASTKSPSQHAKAAQVNAHQRLARQMRSRSNALQQATTWHKPTRLWHWRRRRWKKQSQPPARRGTRSDQKLHRSEVTLGLDRRADTGLFRVDQHGLDRLHSHSTASDSPVGGSRYSYRDVPAEIKSLIAEADGEGFSPAMQGSARPQHDCLSLPRQTMRPADFSARAAQLCNP